MGALIDTGATMTPAELAEHGVDVPQALYATGRWRAVSVSFRVGFVHGLQRHRMTRGGHAYDTDRNRADKEEVAALYRVACRADPEARPTCAPRRVPVAVDVCVHRPLPASRPARVTSEDDTYKPDVDNVAKLVLDALSGVAYEDDAQVVRVCVTKARRRRGVDEHMTVTIRRPDWGDR